MRRCAAKPYEGKDKYIFVSYCHRDRAHVFPIVEQLVKDGYRVWYDEGIDPGSEWPEIIAKHLNGAAVCLAFITENALHSHNCRREINFALLKKKYFISVILEPVQMSLGMEMQLSSSQSIFKYTLPGDGEFFAKLYDTAALKQCKGAPNYSIVVSKMEDHLAQEDDADKGREPFSDRWFVKEATRDLRETLPIEEEARIKAEEEARIKAEEEARIKAEEEARIKAEEEARIKAEEEARIKAEEEARIKAEQEARIKAEEEARIKAEEEARIKAEEEARIKAEEEARIKAEEEARIKAEEEARIKAEEEARIKAEEEARIKAEEEARIKAEEEKKKADKPQKRPVAHILKRVKSGEVIPVGCSPFHIGRATAPDGYAIVENRSVSRRHATLLLRNDVCYLRDNGSLNKTYLNGVMLVPNTEYALKNGDCLRFSSEEFVYCQYQ